MGWLLLYTAHEPLSVLTSINKKLYFATRLAIDFYDRMATKTSFQRKGKKVIDIPGTRASLHNNQLLVSSGIPSLDNVLGKLSIEV